MKLQSVVLIGGVVLAGLALTGAMLDGLVSPAWERVRAREPALRSGTLVSLAGHGVSLAVLGGLRRPVAAAAWLRMHLAWERRDSRSTRVLLQLATEIDPRSITLWLNGARILAYDLPVWRITAAGGFAVVPAGVQRQVVRAQAAEALQFLDRGLSLHPSSADLWCERGNIELHRLDDVEAAAVSFRRAWEATHGPYHAARLHAVLLHRLGRRTEAVAWLRRLLPALPPKDPAARTDLVQAWIREWEQDPSQAGEYRPAPSG
jgi:tetratricopeptide (TPR) repeat protein